MKFIHRRKKNGLSAAPHGPVPSLYYGVDFAVDTKEVVVTFHLYDSIGGCAIRFRRESDEDVRDLLDRLGKNALFFHS